MFKSPRRRVRTKVDIGAPAERTRSNSIKKRTRTSTTRRSIVKSSPQSGQENFETAAIVVEADVDRKYIGNLTDDDLGVSI